MFIHTWPGLEMRVHCRNEWPTPPRRHGHQPQGAACQQAAVERIDHACQYAVGNRAPRYLHATLARSAPAEKVSRRPASPGSHPTSASEISSTDASNAKVANCSMRSAADNAYSPHTNRLWFTTLRCATITPLGWPWTPTCRSRRPASRARGRARWGRRPPCPSGR